MTHTRRLLSGALLPLLLLAGVPAFAQPANKPDSPAAIQAAFTGTAAHLDQGGLSFSYQNIKVLTGLMESVLNNVEKNLPKEQQETQTVLRLIRGLLADSGVTRIEGFGSSLTIDAKRLYTYKTALFAPPAQQQGLIWNLYGRAPHAFPVLAMIPRDALLVLNSDFNGAALWTFFNDSVNRYGTDDIKAMVQSGLQQAAAMGIEPQPLLRSIRSITLVLTNLPKPGGAPIPGFLVVLETADNTVFDLLANQTDPEAAKSGEIVTPIGTVFKNGTALILASDPAAVKNVIAKKSPSLLDNVEFTHTLGSLKAEGNSINFVSGRLGKQLLELLNSMASALPPEGAEMVKSLSTIFSLDAPILSLGAKRADAYVSVAISRNNLPFLLSSSPMLSSNAILAGLLLPALNTARDRARTASCVSNMKQIGLALMMYSSDHAAMPAADGAAGLDELRSQNFLNDSAIFVCKEDKEAVQAAPNAPLTEKNVSYLFIGGKIKLDKLPQDYPLLIEKPSLHANSTAVLFLDGRVESIQGDYRSCLEIAQALNQKYNYPQNVLALLRRKCAAADKGFPEVAAPTAPAAPAKTRTR